jgi:hypothetical protein
MHYVANQTVVLDTTFHQNYLADSHSRLSWYMLSAMFLPLSAPTCISTSAEGAGRNAVGDCPPLKLGVGFMPHFCNECMQGKTRVEIIKGKAEPISDSLQQMDQMVRLKAIDCYICQPDLSDYRMRLYAGHGVAYFVM